MQLRKFYGRTMNGTLARVKRDLGQDALILETCELTPGSAAARLNPGARYEVCACIEPSEAEAPPALAAQPPAAAVRPTALIQDLGLLRAQIRELLDEDAMAPAAGASGVDLADYHALIAQGVDHRVLAPHFRNWLQWRTDPRADAVVPAAGLQGRSLREWLWRAWMAGQGMPGDLDQSDSILAAGRMVAVLGATGVGKTTTLAKIASIIRQDNRQKAVILTLDTRRFGATEQWRRFSRLLGVPVHEIVTPIDLRQSMESWNRFDWIGVDTPGGMTPESEAGQLYGSILARSPELTPLMLLPAAQNEQDGRRQMDWGRALGARRLLFSKLDETSRPGGMVNLTMDGQWKIDSVTTGQRVPQDWEPASGRMLWNRVMATPVVSAFAGGLS